MKALNQNTNINLSGRMHLPSGKAILLAGVCLSLGGASAVGATLLLQPITPTPSHPDVYNNRYVSYPYHIGNEHAALDASYSASAVSRATGWTNGLVRTPTGAYRQVGDYSQKYSRTSMDAKATAMVFGRWIVAPSFNAAVENNNGVRSGSYCFKVNDYRVDGTIRSSYARYANYSTTLFGFNYPLEVAPGVKVNLSAEVDARAGIGLSLGLADNGVNLSGLGYGSIAGVVGVSLQLFPDWCVHADAGVEAELDLGRFDLLPAVAVTPVNLSGKVDLMLSPAAFSLKAFVTAAAPYDVVEYTWSKELAGWSAETKTSTLIQF